MVVNNWYVTVNMYCDVLGKNWPIVFFASFWVCAVLILLNIVTASVIEVYSATEEVLTEKFNFMKNTHYLMDRWKDKTQQEISNEINQIK